MRPRGAEVETSAEPVAPRSTPNASCSEFGYVQTNFRDTPSLKVRVASLVRPAVTALPGSVVLVRSNGLPVYDSCSCVPPGAAKFTVRLGLEASQAGEVIVPITPVPPTWIFLSENPSPQMIVGNGGVTKMAGLFSLLALTIVIRWKTVP